MRDIVHRKNLSDQIYESIQKDILTRRLSFGDLLVNRELREKYNVSSTPVRDAVNRLYQDGLLEDITRDGARVVRIDLAMALEYNELATMINLTAMELSYQKAIHRDVVGQLEEALQMQSGNLLSDDYYQFDQKFHQVFVHNAGNNQLLRLYRRFSTIWDLLSMASFGDSQTLRENAVAQHTLILDAYRKGELPLAREYLTKHYEQAAKQFAATLAP